MATGISIVKWENDVQIITDDYFQESYDYELNYEGKIPKHDIIDRGVQFTYKKILNYDGQKTLYFGDNLDVLKKLILDDEFNGKVKLVYIDPPYATNSVFQSKDQKDSYRDDLLGSHYLEFLRQRLILLRQLLSNDGSIYLHLDSNMIFEAKILLDEIFGKNNYRGLITRKKCSNKNSTTKTYGNISDYILFYSKTNNFSWNRPTTQWTNDKIQKEYPNIDSETGRRYKKVPVHAPGTRNGETGKEWRGMLPPKGKHWQYTPKKLDELDSVGDIYWSSNGNPRRKVYLDEDKGVPVQDIWLDVPDSLNQNIKVTGYPTEKNPFLLERIIKSCTMPGDIVLDCFAGSGTTCGVAEQLDRKWIGIDNSSQAIENIFKRFVRGLETYGDYVEKKEIKKTTDLTLFEPDLRYDAKKFKIVPFNFYSDARYSEYIERLLKDDILKLQAT